MKKSVLIFLVLATALAGCRKDQKTVKKLDGGWVLSTITSGGTEITYQGIGKDSIRGLDEMFTYKFMSCKVKKDSCYGEVSGILSDTVSAVTHGITYPFTYTVDKDALSMFIDFGTGMQTIDITISELKKDRLILDFTSEGQDFEATLIRSGSQDEAAQ